MMNKTLVKIILCLLLALFVLPVQGAIPASERAALIAFYTSTNGAHWNNNNGWKTPPLHTDGFAMPGTEGSWFGVYVHADHVDRINLCTNNLSGPLPDEIGQLPYLANLYLTGNKLTSPLPIALGSITTLSLLALDQNQLTGSIPGALGQLVNLQTLTLRSNQLTGTIPTQLGNLSKLYSCDLSNNQLTGSIPVAMCSLPRLNSLVLANNKLSGSIPTEIGNLTNLRQINLSTNQLTGSIPASLFNIIYLWFIDLSDNKLSGYIPEHMNQLAYLCYLYLNKNNLSGSIPTQLGNLRRLIKLDISENQLTGAIPAQLGNLASLSQLILNNNRLSGSIPPELGHISGLTRILLGTNQLTGAIPPELGNLTYLNYLSLSENQLSGFIPPQLGNLNYLTHLSLRDNQLTGPIPAQLCNIWSLDFLTLRNNQLSGPIPAQIGKLVNLTTFRVNNNFLSGDIPVGITELTKISTLDLGYNCLLVRDFNVRIWLNITDPDWETHQDQCHVQGPVLVVNRTHLNFGGSTSGNPIPPQTIMISNAGSGTLNWTAVSDATWLTVYPASGTGNGMLTIVISPTGLNVGEYTSAIHVTAQNATGSPQTISVSLHLYSANETAVPFGEFATPLDGAAVSNSIAVTGWALDDTGIASVKIYNGDNYVGDAVFVDGARPDVEATFPTYPNVTKAGWGYMLLTHFLPGGGNGTYTLTAKATDLDGNVTVLGAKTITVDNAHAVKPFGAIDTPTQGGTASGKEYVNYGWVLTPLPNNIPANGYTIKVYIDGVFYGYVTYGGYRSDIAQLFPALANSNGAGGSFYIDTTKLKNGIHTISWDVSDSQLNADGVGSRYFNVFNPSLSSSAATASAARKRNPPVLADCEAITNPEQPLEITEMGRLTIDLNAEDMTILEGYSVVHGKLRALPVGSTVNNGIFYWQPGPGFVGSYNILLMGKNTQGQNIQKNVLINIKPKQ